MLKAVGGWVPRRARQAPRLGERPEQDVRYRAAGASALFECGENVVRQGRVEIARHLEAPLETAEHPLARRIADRDEPRDRPAGLAMTTSSPSATSSMSRERCVLAAWIFTVLMNVMFVDWTKLSPVSSLKSIDESTLNGAPKASRFVVDQRLDLRGSIRGGRVRRHQPAAARQLLEKAHHRGRIEAVAHHEVVAVRVGLALLLLRELRVDDFFGETAEIGLRSARPRRRSRPRPCRAARVRYAVFILAFIWPSLACPISWPSTPRISSSVALSMSPANTRTQPFAIAGTR